MSGSVTLHMQVDEDFDTTCLIDSFVSRGERVTVHLSRRGAAGYEVFVIGRSRGIDATHVESYWLADCSCP